MGKADRLLRLILATVGMILFWTGIITGVFGYIILGFSIVFFITTTAGYCPLYTLFGINTCKKKSNRTV